MSTYNPESGKVLVPFDLRKDVIDRLDRVEEKVDASDGRIASHVATHEADRQAREAQRQVRRRRVINTLKAAGAAAGVLIPAVLAAIFGSR